MTPSVRSISNLVLHNRLREQELEREFLDGLQNRKIPSKFLYWGKKESENWVNLCKDRSYRYYHQETRLLKKSAESICKRIFQNPGQNYNLISLGIGNGEKDAILLETCTKLTGRLDFFPVDVSEDMIHQGLSRIPSQMNMNIEGYVADFNDIEHLTEQIRAEHFSNHCIVLLGNTLGGIQDLRSLQLLRKMMQSNDLILVGFLLDQNDHHKNSIKTIQSALEMYSSSAFQKFVFSPLERVGMNMSQGNFEVTYGPNRLYPTLNTIEVFFSMNKHHTMAYRNEEISFLKGERIRLFHSHLYREEIIDEILENYRLQVLERFFSSDKMAGIFLCSV